MRLAIVGSSGSGKTTVARELAAATGARHVEIDALWHGPDWQACGADELCRRVVAATEGGSWICDGTYHTVIGDLVLERAETIAWLDLPVPVVMWRLVRRTFVRTSGRRSCSGTATSRIGGSRRSAGSSGPRSGAPSRTGGSYPRASPAIRISPCTACAPTG